MENDKLNIIGTSTNLYHVKLITSSPALCEFVRICAHELLPITVIQGAARQLLQEAGLEVCEENEPISKKNQVETNPEEKGVIIKPCQFCGEQPDIRIIKKYPKFSFGCQNPECPVRPWVGDFSKLQEAIETWNSFEEVKNE